MMGLVDTATALQVPLWYLAAFCGALAVSAIVIAIGFFAVVGVVFWRAFRKFDGFTFRR